MSKIQCRHCGFNNPANLDVCVKCNKPFHSNVGQKWLTKFTQLFPTSKKTPTAPDKQIEKIKDLSSQVILSVEGVHYDVGGLLGRGGYCDVYIGRNQQTNEKVAIKLLRFWEIVQRAREEVETRFWFEYRMALTDSPYLVKATEHGDVGGNPFYIMECCEGGVLGDRIGQKWTDTRLRKLAQDILMGLQVLHQQGVVHRDLKPQNIIYKDGKPKLIDFGVSGRKNVKMTQHAQVLGTDVYLAPEWFNAEQKEVFSRLPTIDIYSFGLLMFEVITGGSNPYSSVPDSNDKRDAYDEKLKAYYDNVQHNRYQNLIAYYEAGKISDFWASLIQKCLFVSPEKRFQQVSEIISLLGNPQPDNHCPTCDYPLQHRRMTQCPDCRNYLLTNGTMGLRIVMGKRQGHYVNLSLIQQHHNAITLGRLLDEHEVQNDIVLEDIEDMKTVSRYHATIEKSEKMGQWFVRDGQWRPNHDGEYTWQLSKNGVIVNGTRADYLGLPFYPDDIIAIGNTMLKVEYSPD